MINEGELGKVMKTIDADTLTRMFFAGAARLEANKEIINELNVFPVPDGDTGTNMTLTIMSAVSEVQDLSDKSMKAVAKAISSGSLKGARGNSGVILSQLLRGCTKVIRNYEVVDAQVLSMSLQKAVETAYKAVMKPKEGTILTVARGVADKASEMALEVEDIEPIFQALVEEAEIQLEHTPELLPVLKEAGVVDSGGRGFLEILKGADDALLGKEIDYSALKPREEAAAGETADEVPEEEKASGYCTSFTVHLMHELDDTAGEKFRLYLESLGEAVVLASSGGTLKVHADTEHPGKVIEKALGLGILTDIRIENLGEETPDRLQAHAEEVERAQEAAAAPEGPRKEMGFISVASGEGLAEIFKGLGVDYVIEGGQTMNPSTDDMLKAVAKVNADHVFILPNNKNIILAANQAKAMTTDKDIIVIPSRTIPQGITAMINYMTDSSVFDNTQRMNEGLGMVKTGQVTYAVRDTRVDEQDIKEGDIMGLGDDGILAVGKDIEEVTLALFEKLIDDESELISIYYGQDVTREAAEALASKLGGLYSSCDVEVHSGGQPIYYYVTSVE